MADSKLLFTKLNRDNYEIWKYRMQLLLKKEKVWDVINEEIPENPDVKWKERDTEASILIGLAVEESEIFRISNCKFAKDAWNVLKSYHEKSSLSNKVKIMRTICELKLLPGDDMDNHINKMKLLFSKLQSLGEKLSESWLISMLLSSLSASYDTLITALEVREESDLTITIVENKLLEEFEKQNKRKTTEDTVLKTTNKNKFHPNKKIVCHNCHGIGHIRKDCWKLKKKPNVDQKATVVEENKDFENYCFILNGSQGVWVVDSGATCHICSDKSEFVQIDTTWQEKVTVANGDVVKSSGRGVCKLSMTNEMGDEVIITVNDVLYIPSFKGNLLSVKKLSGKGFTVVFCGRTCKILNEKNAEIGVADLVNNLYQLRGKQNQEAQLAVCNMKHCQHYYHKLFGHRDMNVVKSMQCGKVDEDFKISDCGVRKTCDVCVKCKLTQKPFPKKSFTETGEVLDVIHTDICGPMQTVTPGKKKYFVTFIDDFSRYTVVYLLHDKSEVFDKTKQFVEMVKNKFGRVPKCIRSDNGTEYKSKKMLEYLQSYGIQSQLTVPYCPQQNGVSERKNRYLVEMARCLLEEADLLKTYWGEAIMCANYLQNRLVTSSKPCTPYERWEGQKPNIKNLHIFGSKAYVLVPHVNRRKLDNKSNLLTFMGYDEHSKGLRFVDTTTNKLTVSRDFKFVSSNETQERQFSQSTLNNEVEINIFSKLRDESNGLEHDLADDETDDGSYCSLNTDLENFEGVDSSDTVEMESSEPVLRKSCRMNKGVPPRRFSVQKVVSADIIEPKTFKEAVFSKEKLEWEMAMKEEMNSLVKNHTWDLVCPPPKANIVGCKWIYKVKRNNDGNIKRFKARLVAQGFNQKYGCDYDEVFAPVVRQATFRILMSIAGMQNMYVEHMDIKCAFLNGYLEETIYMKQPPGFIEGDGNLVCKLRRSLYGLKQAANVWNKVLHDVLIGCGFIQSKADPCLYSKCIKGEDIYVLIYVDDLLVASKAKDNVNNVYMLLNTKFEVNNLGPITQFLGIEVKKTNDSKFMIRQKGYIEKVLDKFGLQESKISKYPLDPSYGKTNSELLMRNTEYQCLTGSLLYISVNSRPDIAASVAILARKTSNPTQEDWNELKRVAKYLKGTADMYLQLCCESEVPNVLYGYADANWAECRTDRKSNSGYVFLLNGCAVSWGCKKQTVVSLSTTEAEFVALSDTAKEVVWLRNVLADFGYKQTNPTTIYEDNRSCLNLIKDEKLSNRTKHIDTKYHFVKDYVDKKIIECVYCPTEEMLADMLTKPLSISKLEKFRSFAKIIYI